MAKKPLQVGDRIAVYGIDGNGAPIRKTATIESFTKEGAVYVTDPESLHKVGPAGYDLTMPHPKSCRRLVKKPRRRVWVKMPTDFHPQHLTNGMVSVVPVAGWSEFVEVRKKK